MEVALNIGVQLGGVVRKEANQLSNGALLGRQNEKYEGAPGQDGEEKDFLTVILDRSTPTKDEAVGGASTPDDPDSFPLKLQFGSPTALKIDNTESKSGEPQPQTVAFAAIHDNGIDPRGRQSGASSLLVSHDAEIKLHGPQLRTPASVVLDSADSEALIISDNDQVELAPSVGLIAANRSATDDQPQARRPSQSEAKAEIVEGTQRVLTLKGPPIVLGGLSQSILPDTENPKAEEIRPTEKQTQQPATFNDLPRATLSRQAALYSSASTGDTVTQVLIANSGEVAISDFDLDMAVDFISGKRLIGQAASIPQALTSSTATPAPVPLVGATAQIIAAIKASRFSDTIEIRLDPPELGRVKIEFAMETMDSVRAILSAERGETLDHMRKNIGELAAQLKDAGFKSMEFEFAKNSEHEFSTGSAAQEAPDKDGGGLSSLGQGEIVYLSIRSDAQLDLLA